jgi:hypothetical protein
MPATHGAAAQSVAGTSPAVTLKGEIKSKSNARRCGAASEASRVR